MIERPPQDDRPKRVGGRIVIFFVLSALLVSLSLLLTLPLGVFGPVIIGGACLFVLMMLAHYYLWGRWIAQVVRAEQETSEEQEGE